MLIEAPILYSLPTPFAIFPFSKFLAAGLHFSCSYILVGFYKRTGGVPPRTVPYLFTRRARAPTTTNTTVAK
jgi:hypothetical protein